MSNQPLDRKLARAVQDEVISRRGGEAPSYNYCLNLVRTALAERVRDDRPAGEWQADIVKAVAEKTS